ncbi:hypothetical protein, partial [Stenotrophomonas sp. SY1]|uniref:hypothetical protein n=1 Tax=Stenotrophomonas sp. SY1 TaxID=477235 RepID=UPI001E2A295D
ILPFQENFLSITKLLKRFNVIVVFKNDSTVKHKLINNSIEIKKGCIYKIPCKMYNQFYIGQTAKPLNIRIEQHKKNVRDGNHSSGIFKHIELNNHPVDWGNAQAIYYTNNIIARNLIECSLIHTTSNQNANLHKGLYKLDNFICQEISRIISGKM